MKQEFLEWLRELFPNDHAVVEQYPLSELQKEYPELYDDFKQGNSTEFAKLFIEKNMDWSVYDDARTMYEHQRQEVIALKVKNAELEKRYIELQTNEMDILSSFLAFADGGLMISSIEEMITPNVGTDTVNNSPLFQEIKGKCEKFVGLHRENDTLVRKEIIHYFKEQGFYESIFEQVSHLTDGNLSDDEVEEIILNHASDMFAFSMQMIYENIRKAKA